MIDEFEPLLRSYARRQRAFDYESVANTAMADAIRNLPRFRGTDRRAFRSYAYQIVKRRIVDELRKQASQPVMVTGYDDKLFGSLVDEENSTFDNQLVETEATNQLLSHLTEDQREVVEMRVLTGLSIRETADNTGRSVTAVKAMQRRAFVSLRAVITSVAILLICLVGLVILDNLGGGSVIEEPAGQEEQQDGERRQSQDRLQQEIPVPDGAGSTVSGAPLSGTLAFPGASGWASEVTTGGRGGRVVIVNSLENTVDPDDDVVTFREAMTQIDEPRIIVFSVAGTIDYRDGTELPGSQLVLNGSDDNVTVACQSAPEPGITFVGEGIRFGSEVDNVIMRHCRLRNTAPRSAGSAENNSCLRVVGRGDEAPSRYIFDHISCMWASSTSIAFTVPALAEPEGDSIQDVSVSNTIVAEGALSPGQDADGSGPVSEGSGLNCSSAVDARTVERCSFVGNFIAHYERQGARVSSVNGAEVTNNIAYNFSTIGLQAKSPLAAPRTLDGSITGNLVQYGPDSKASTGQLFRPIDLSGNTSDNTSLDVSGNYVTEVGQQPANVEAPLFDTNGSPSVSAPSAVGDILSMSQPGSDHLRCVGASRPQRDSHDQRVIDEFLSGSGTVGVRSDQTRDFSEYPITPARQLWVDVDQDGMPDTWEQKLGIEDPAANDVSSTYTNVEVFLNGLAQCPGIAIDPQQGAAFSTGSPVSIPFSTNWQLWDGGRTIEVCIDDQCGDYLDPDGDQVFEISDLSAGDHSATFTLRSPTGVAVVAPVQTSFTVN